MTTIMERRGTARREMSGRPAKQGMAFGHTRYVQGVSVLLAALAGIFLYLAFFY